MTRALFRHYAAIAWASPVYRTCLVAAAVVGALATLYPIGLRTTGSAAGLLGGAGLGIATAAVLLPFAMATLLLATLGADEDLGLVDEFRLSGIAPGPRWRAGAVATFAVGLSAMWPAPLVGALSGLGDAVRTSSPLVGRTIVNWTFVGGAVAAAVYFLVLALGLLALSRSPVNVAVALPLGFGVFLSMLMAFHGGIVRDLMKALPFAPVWATVFPRGRSAYVLSMTVGARVAVAAAWVVLAVVACVVRLRLDARGRS